MKKWCPHYKTLRHVIIELNINLLYDNVEIPFLGIYPREIKTYIHTKNLYMNVYKCCNHTHPKLKGIQMFFQQANETVVHS